MELAKYFKEFDDANRAQDHYKMMEAMQKFFKEIHNADETEILSYYSMASQFELLGMNAQPIKDAVTARVKSQYNRYPGTWKSTAVGLNALLYSDQRSYEKIQI
ncbi:MAG TPA: hypothetical protein PK886_01005 [Candidatus Paceibacterota bacterium]|nr:hypothetical protein [Candidatus Paceibacterota bacterium]